MLDLPRESPLGLELTPFVVQCKWVTSALGQAAISGTVSYLSLHRAQGLLIISTGGFSGTAVTKANAISQDTTNPYTVILWDSTTLHAKLDRHPWIATHYWHRNSQEYSGGVDVDKFPAFSRASILQRLQRDPVYADTSTDWYRKTPSYPPTQLQAVADLIDRYRTAPPVVLVITGAIGSGKTSLAHILLTEVGACPDACMSYHMYNELYYYYARDRGRALPLLLGALLDLDFLIIDDFGYRLPNGTSNSPPAKLLIDLVRKRANEGRPTIVISAGAQMVPDSIQEFTRWATRYYHSIHLGDHSWRKGAKPPEVDEEDKRRYTGFMSRGWLSEKMTAIEESAERAIDLLTKPDEQIEAHSDFLGEMGHGAPDRTQLVKDEIEIAIALSREYRHFIESLPWRHISFHNVELHSTKPTQAFEVRGTETDES